MRTCYLVAMIDCASLRVLSVGLFSEPSPSMRFGHVPAVLSEISARTFAEAHAHMRNAIKDPMWAWVLPLLGDRDRREGGA